MKNLRLLLVFTIGFLVFGSQTVTAQEKENDAQEMTKETNVLKDSVVIEKIEVEKSLKNALKDSVVREEDVKVTETIIKKQEEKLEEEEENGDDD